MSRLIFNTNTTSESVNCAIIKYITSQQLYYDIPDLFERQKLTDTSNVLPERLKLTVSFISEEDVVFSVPLTYSLVSLVDLFHVSAIWKNRPCVCKHTTKLSILNIKYNI